MKQLTFLATLILACSPALFAQGGPGIIPIGSSIRFGGVNSPDTYSDASTFGPNPVLVNNGRVRIWQEQVPTGTNGEWDVFHMQIVNGGPLAGNLNGNWSIVIEYNLRVPVLFDGSVVQFKVDGRPVSSITNFGTVCCASLSNPILPGPAFYNTGMGNLPAGVQSNWQQIFINPYSFANSGGVPTATANELSFALHFTLRPAGPPTVTSLISAGGFGALPAIASGSWIEIFGTNFAVGNQTWASGDFDAGFAPTRLGGVTVSVGGRPAFVNFISPTQVNVQVPSGVGTGSQNVVVTTPVGPSAPVAVNVESTKPGLLAPASFRLGGVQNVVALFTDQVTFVLPPGAIAGVPSRRARPGETIILYGIGFGPVTPNIVPGQVAQQLNSLNTAVSIRIGGAEANVTYAGLAPNTVGLYQFNVVVPAIQTGDAVPVTFSQGGTAAAQTLAIAIGN